MYKVSESTANCDSNLVVYTKEECKAASMQLDLSFKHSMDNTERHAGCYKDNGFVYFNTITNPSDTTPSFGEKIDRRAICGTNLLYCAFYIYWESLIGFSKNIYLISL